MFNFVGYLKHRVMKNATSATLEQMAAKIRDEAKGLILQPARIELLARIEAELKSRVSN